MRATFLFTLLLCLTTGLFAQRNVKSVQTNTNAVASDPTVAGKLIAQLTAHISPSALSPKFVQNEKGWLLKANRCNNMTSLAWFVQNLQENLNTTAYTSDWNNVSGRWATELRALNTVKQAASLVKTLEENLQKSAFDKTWSKDKKGWESSINGIN